MLDPKTFQPLAEKQSSLSLSKIISAIPTESKKPSKLKRLKIAYRDEHGRLRAQTYLTVESGPISVCVKAACLFPSPPTGVTPEKLSSWTAFLPRDLDRWHVFMGRFLLTTSEESTAVWEFFDKSSVFRAEVRKLHEKFTITST